MKINGVINTSTFVLALDDASLDQHWACAMEYLEQHGHDIDAMMRDAVAVVNAWKDNPAQDMALTIEDEC